MFEQLATYINIGVTLLWVGVMIWRRSASISGINEKINATAKDSQYKDELQQKDILALLENKAKMRDKVNEHDQRISNFDVRLERLDAWVTMIKEAVQRIEKKLE